MKIPMAWPRLSRRTIPSDQLLCAAVCSRTAGLGAGSVVPDIVLWSTAQEAATTSRRTVGVWFTAEDDAG